jgi:hypothetical protein
MEHLVGLQGSKEQKQKVMKTRIEIKGENHNEVRAFANILLTLIENYPAEYDSIVRVDDSTSFNKLTATFVAYQADRTEVNVEELIDSAKDFAESEGKDYDGISINTVDDYCEEDEEFTSSYPDEIFHVEENVKTWDIYSNIFGDDEPAQTYRKCDYSLKEAIADYKENGIY